MFVREQSNFLLILFVAQLFVVGCTTMSDFDREQERYPLIADLFEDRDAFLYFIYPNDSMPGDSALAHLGRGVVMTTQPGANYKLEIEGFAELELNLFEMVGETVRKSPLIIRGHCSESRCLFEFEGQGSEVRWWVAALSSDNGKVGITSPEYFSFGGEGVARDTLEITLLFLGALSTLETDSAKNRFALELIEHLQELYATTGIKVKQRATFFPSNLPSQSAAEVISDRDTVHFNPELWMLKWGKSQENSLHLDQLSFGLGDEGRGALKIAIVEMIDGIGYMGVAPLFGLTLFEGPLSTAVIGMHTLDRNRNVEPNSQELIFETIAHEIAHFLGLRHTTSTPDDRMVTRDQSILEDGLSDTPYNPLCGAALNGQSAYVVQKNSLPFQVRILSQFSQREQCPDVENLMFPLAVDGVRQTQLTPSQGAVMRANLHLLSRAD